MKAGDTFKLDSKWWRDNQPKTLKSTGLGEALDSFAKAESQFNNRKSYDAYTQCVKALETVDQCRVKAIKACGSLHPETKDALGKDKAILLRHKLLLQVMAKQLDLEVKKYEADLKTEFKVGEQMQERLKNCQQMLQVAQGGDKAAATKFKKMITNFSNNSSLSGPEDLTDKVRHLHQQVMTMPAAAKNFKAHLQRMNFIVKATFGLQKERRSLRKFFDENKNAIGET